MKIPLLLNAVSAVLCTAFSLDAGERRDPRVRTYVDPVRIVWTSPAAEEYHAVHPQVTNADILLSPRQGQVPEGLFWSGSGCTLKSVAALPAGLLLDFGRELHGSVELQLGAPSTKGMQVRIRLGESVAEAMSLAGENGRGLDTVRDYWGAMLDMGATSFWEDFRIAWTNGAFRIDELPVVGKRDIHGDCGQFCYKGFRHSLCHGWASGPAAWCIDRVLGIRVVERGAKAVLVRPDLGGLDWAEGALPVPQGLVKVRAERRADGTLEVSVQAPEGVRVIR